MRAVSYTHLDGYKRQLDNLYEELTLYPRDSDELTVIRNSIMGGLSGFNATFSNRIHRWLEQVDAGVPRAHLDASGHEGLAVQETVSYTHLDVYKRQGLYPWVAKDSEQSGVLIFERNPYYFKVDTEGKQLPYVDKLISTLVQDTNLSLIHI